MMNPLEKRIGYKFRNSLLLAEALTHSSLRHEEHHRSFDNQRLEFLGDAVLELVFTDILYRRFPDFPEGELTKLRSRLVSRSGLKVLADKIDLGKYLMMGRGEEAAGGRERSSIMSDAFEGLIGAIYLDSGLESVYEFISREAQEQIDAFSSNPSDHNPKGNLQEILQSISPQSPVYHLVSEEGPEHQKVFTTNVLWGDLQLGSGQGSSKKLAEAAAARNALKLKLWTTLNEPK